MLFAAVVKCGSKFVVTSLTDDAFEKSPRSAWWRGAGFESGGVRIWHAAFWASVPRFFLQPSEESVGALLPVVVLGRRSADSFCQLLEIEKV
jgi:hypothetical protein